jgi:hypothetical protein
VIWEIEPGTRIEERIGLPQPGLFPVAVTFSVPERYV